LPILPSGKKKENERFGQPRISVAGPTSRKAQNKRKRRGPAWAIQVREKNPLLWICGGNRRVETSASKGLRLRIEKTASMRIRSGEVREKEKIKVNPSGLFRFPGKREGKEKRKQKRGAPQCHP